MADSSAEEFPAKELVERSHDCILCMANCAWAVVDMAHGGEAHLPKRFPFREFIFRGKPRSIPPESLSKNPSALAGLLASIKELIQRQAKIESEFGQLMVPVLPDGTSLNSGAGGMFGPHWHSVATQLFLKVAELANYAFDLSKVSVIAGERPMRMTDTMLREADGNLSLIQTHDIERFYGAIRRSISPFNIDQLSARLSHELSSAIAGVSQDCDEPGDDLEDPITIANMAKLGKVPVKTVRNWGIDDRPKPKIPQRGKRPAVFSYLELRSWFVAKQPDKINYWPEEYKKAVSTLSKMSS
jgi:hypothetical protein